MQPSAWMLATSAPQPGRGAARAQGGAWANQECMLRGFFPCYFPTGTKKFIVLWKGRRYAKTLRDVKGKNKPKPKKPQEYFTKQFEL